MDKAELFGIGIALITALGWGWSTIVLKPLTAKIDTFSLNMLRLWTGAAVLLAFILFSGRGELMRQTALAPLLLVIASGIMAMAIGDSLYIKSLSLIDASKAFTIAQCAFPVLTSFVAVMFLKEAFTWRMAIGAGLVLCGIRFIAGKSKKGPGFISSPDSGAKGIVLALLAALGWTASTTFLTLGVAQMDTFVAAGIRIPAAAVVMSLLMLSRKMAGSPFLPRIAWKTAALAGLAGLLSYGVSAVGYVTAIQTIGAAKTVLITTTAPILVLPFSILVLKEKPGAPAVTGIFSCVLGICFIAS